MLYLDRTTSDSRDSNRQYPIYKNWTDADIQARAVEEMRQKSFGTFEIVNPFVNTNEEGKGKKDAEKKDLKLNKKKVILLIIKSKMILY